jgi:hypothetical protein
LWDKIRHHGLSLADRRHDDGTRTDQPGNRQDDVARPLTSLEIGARAGAEGALLCLWSPRAILATGKLVGEGFDHPPLDTLVLAMPVSWKGTLQQYAGRLHREHATKSNVRIIDFVDTGHPALLRMWEKRRQGYRAMGYRIDEECISNQALAAKI